MNFVWMLLFSIFVSSSLFSYDQSYNRFVIQSNFMHPFSSDQSTGLSSSLTNPADVSTSTVMASINPMMHIGVANYGAGYTQDLQRHYENHAKAHFLKNQKYASTGFSLEEKLRRLPKRTTFPFQAAYNKDGMVATNKHGDLLDNKGNRWVLSPDGTEWEISNKSRQLLKKEKANIPDSKKTDFVETPQNSRTIAVMESMLSAIVLANTNFYEANFDGMSADFFTTFQELQNSSLNHEERSVLTSKLNFQMMHHLVKTGQIHRGIIKKYEKHPWAIHKDLTEADFSEQCMANFMLDSMAFAENDTTIEIAQAGLREWTDGIQSKTEEEYLYHMNRSNQYYGSLRKQLPTHSITDYAQPMDQTIAMIDDFFEKYAATVKEYYKDAIGELSDLEQEHLHRIEKRLDALEKSKKQVRPENRVQQTYAMSPCAQAFFMEHNLNYAVFNGGVVTDFQHCLTQEVLGIIESSVEVVRSHHYESMIKNFTIHNCQLAVSGQQLNQLARLNEAVAVIDYSHFFENIARFIYGDKLYGAMDIGAAKSLDKWMVFAYKLGSDPKATVKDLAEDCLRMGEGLCFVANFVHDVTPLRYVTDLARELVSDPSEDESVQFARIVKRDEERTERSRKTIKAGLVAADNIIKGIVKKSVHENLVDASEFVCDLVLTDKITQGFFKLAHFVGKSALQAGNAMQNMLPPELMDSSLKLSTNAGEVVAVFAETGETVSSVAAAAQAAERITQIAGNVTRAKDLLDGLKDLLQPDPEKLTEFQKTIEPYLRQDKLVNVDRLRSIEGVDQVQRFKDYTNNFHPDELAKLKPEEILYLNLCDWLAPKADIINAALKKKGGIRIVDSVTGVEAYYEKYDLFHSLLGEMSPGAVANRTSGGHLMIPELRGATLKTGKVIPIGHGFFDIDIQYLGKESANYKKNSVYPLGTLLEESVEMLEKATEICTEISIEINPKNSLQQIVKIKNKNSQSFYIRIENKIAEFYPGNI
ncbi:hypothetical protein KBC04_02745 [Candidatus Babeliales bacterium]|nr:hypothetical protein [Candidatus Babeliales bacterium]